MKLPSRLTWSDMAIVKTVSTKREAVEIVDKIKGAGFYATKRKHTGRVKNEWNVFVVADKLMQIVDELVPNTTIEVEQ